MRSFKFPTGQIDGFVKSQRAALAKKQKVNESDVLLVEISLDADFEVVDLCGCSGDASIRVVKKI